MNRFQGKVMKKMWIVARARVIRSLTIALLMVMGSACLMPRIAQALPPDCTTPGNICVAPHTTPWAYHVYTQYAFPDISAWSESEAISKTQALVLNGTGWCSAALASVTRDDGYAWGG